ncbi:MAG: rod-binding protein [Desulfobacterales bacterium]
MIQTVTPASRIPVGQNDGSYAKLKSACSEFEAIFINYMLKSMRTAVSENGVLENSNESQIIRSMFDENLAAAMAKGGGMGLGNMLFESYKA